ncbi:MAG TPA: 2OG-Fe(II) oxygenase [Beijerinckiaceae bacterium]|nr:2OG-Fe(II) oxygenase [Beijerinckiaceae bacterium]
MSFSTLNVDAVRQAPVSREPYTWFLGSGILRQDVIDDLRHDFPNITKPGGLTVEEVDLKGRFKTLIDELESDEFSAELSKKFGLDLTRYPRLTTIMRQSTQKYGSIHTDGPSKVMTLLVYMNDNWRPDGAGRLRVLYNQKDFEPYAVEVPPTMGTVFAFLRADNSWHGHLPYTGERRVVQVAWVKDASEVARKKKRNKVAQFFKGIFGR